MNVDPVDVDKDKLSLLDLVVSNETAGSVQVFQNDGAGDFFAPISLEVDDGPTQIETADLDGNTYPDIVTTNGISGTVSVVMNDGAFSFRNAVHLPLGSDPRSLSFVDLDEDLDDDIAVIADNDIGNAVVMILRNDTPAGGTLSLTLDDELGEGDNPIKVKSGDVDGDNDRDLITINMQGAAPRSGGGNRNRDRGLLNFMRVHPNDLYTSCVGDTSGDGIVDVTDLLELIGAWGPCKACAADFNADNIVNISDLLELIGAWGVCP